MAHNQLIDFLDNLDTSVHRHIVMLYEEPEYAKSIQIRFLNDGLKNGECCVYAAPDYDNLRLIETDMIQYGIDVDEFKKKGLLQLYVRGPVVNDSESYRQARTDFQEEIENTFLNARSHSTAMPRIRGVGSMFPHVFPKVENANSKDSSTESQLLVEKLFQSESTDSFGGVWMCAYQVDDILPHMDEEWMKQLLSSHDAVLFLRKLSNGIALDIRK